ncbi:DUF4013 domain-containing protein [Halobacteria archaeon AArc-dxtr1]|nr:DUF4013 domain-containing protein [Halobacteria archaeon AArc-dxtr1]
MPYCSNCGAETEAGQRYCSACGAALHDVDEPGTGDADDATGAGRAPVASTASEPDGSRDAAGNESRDAAGNESRDASGTKVDAGADSIDATLEQDIDTVLEDAIRYPGRNGWGTVLIGGVLGLFSFLLIPIVLLAGYFVRVTEHAATQRPNPPRFDDWVDLLRLGALVIVAFVPFLIVSGVVIAAVGAASDGLAALVSLLAYYVAPAILLRFAVTQSLSETYDVDRMQALLTHRTYVVGLLVLIVVAVLGWFAVIFISLASVLTIVGWIIIIPTAVFYYLAVLHTLLGRISLEIQFADEPETTRTGHAETDPF